MTEEADWSAVSVHFGALTKAADYFPFNVPFTKKKIRVRVAIPKYRKAKGMPVSRAVLL